MSKPPLLDHFGLLAPFYDRVLKPPAHSRLEELLELPVAGRMLDAAGGTGRISARLAALTGGVVIADESSGMLMAARGKNCCLLAQSHTERLPFDDGSFERIIMVDALHHVIDQPGTLRELWRVLAPGGRIVIEDMNLHTVAVKLVAAAEKLALMRSHFLYPEEIARHFERLGARPRTILEGWSVWVVAER